MVSGIILTFPTLGAENKTISLKGLESRILKYNLEIQRATENEKIAKYKDEQATDNEYNDSSDPIESEKNSEYYELEAEMNLYYSICTKEKIEKEKVLEGTEKFFTYQFLSKEIELQNQKIERLKDDLVKVNVKIDMGNSTLNDRTKLELSIQKEVCNLQKLKNNRERVLFDLNVLMNYDLETALVFETPDVPFEKYTTKNLTKQIEDVIENNEDLEKIEYQNRLVDIELKIYEDNNSGQYDNKITKIKEDKTNLVYDFKDKKLNLEYEVRSKYNDLLTSYDNLNIKELEIANLEITLKTVEKRYDLGLESESNMILAKEDFEFAKLELEKAKLAYYLTVESYKSFID